MIIVYLFMCVRSQFSKAVQWLEVWYGMFVYDYGMTLLLLALCHIWIKNFKTELKQIHPLDAA